jgi:hypothetical protein
MIIDYDFDKTINFAQEYAREEGGRRAIVAKS